jgi:NADH:ubiquinone oxidoreductase subunit H
VKFLFKEDLTPPHVYKPLYMAAPMIAVIFALTSIAVIPFGNRSRSSATPFRCRSPMSTLAC